MNVNAGELEQEGVRLRIMYPTIYEAYGGSCSINVVNTASGWMTEGHEVSVGMRSDDNVEPTRLRKYYGIEAVPDIWIHSVARRGIRSWIAQALLGLRIAMRTAKMDGVLYSRQILLVLAAAILRVPYAVELHQLPKGRLRKGLVLRLSRSRSCQAVVAISAQLRDALARLGLDEQKLVVAHDGAPTWRGSEARSEPSDFTVIYAGSFQQGKGIEVILAVARRRPRWRIVLAGWEANGYRLPHPLPENVEYVGRIAPGELTHYLRAAHVGVCPNAGSTGSGEAWTQGYNWCTSPLKIFEYWAHGLPVVASRLPSIEEIVEEGQTGLLAEPGDVDDWLSQLERLKESRTLRDRIRREARVVVEGRWAWRTRAQTIADALATRLNPAYPRRRVE